MRWKNKKTLFIYVSLIIIFCFAFVLRLLPFRGIDKRLITNWGDDWWFLGMARYFSVYHKIPEMEPTYGGVLKYDYPPGLMLLFAVLNQITGVEMEYLGRYVAIGLGSLTAVFVYVLGKKLTNDYRVGLLASVLTVTSVRYITRTAGFTSELMDHLLIPATLIFLYKAIKEDDDTSLSVSGLLLGGVILSHHLSSAVMLIVLSFFSFLLLVSRRKQGIPDIKKVLIVMAIGLFITFPFWIVLVEGGIMNIVVKEAYGREGFLNIKGFYKSIGIPQFFLGVLGLGYAIYRRKIGDILLVAWALPCILGLWDRTIAQALFGNNLLKYNPDLLYVFSPSLYTRYFEFMAQPISLLGASFFFSFFGSLKKIKILNRPTIFLEIISLVLILILVPLPVNSKTFYEGSGYGWIKWAMVNFVSVEEYEASVWIRENLPDDVNILSDYEANEMIFGVTAKTVANGGTLRASLPVGTIFTDHLTIYFTSDLGEALSLIKKYKITHVFLSERMVDKGWFCIERNARFNYSYGGDMHNADLDKFEKSGCFEKIYNENRVKIYEINYQCNEMQTIR